MGTPTQYLCDYCNGWVRLPRLVIRAKFGALVMLVIEMCELNIEYDWEMMRIYSTGGQHNAAKMRTKRLARHAAKSFRRRSGVRVGRVVGYMIREVSNRGNVGNQNGNVVNENVHENVGNVLVNGNRIGCLYKELLACNPKEYDGKGGAIVLTRWIEKMKNIHTLSGEVAVSMSWNDFKFMIIQEFCPSHEMQKLESELWNHAMVGAGHAAYTDRFHELARLVPHLVTPESRMIERYVYGLDRQIRGMGGSNGAKGQYKGVKILVHDRFKAVRNGSIKRTWNAFATTINPVGRENTGTWPKCTPTTPTYVLEGRIAYASTVTAGSFERDLEVVPRIESLINVGRKNTYQNNRAQGPGENRPNQVAANNEGQGRGNQGNQARGRAFMLGEEEALPGSEHYRRVATPVARLLIVSAPSGLEGVVETTQELQDKENKEHFLFEKEAIFLLLTGIGDDIYSTVDSCKTANEMWIAH
ncbi:putative reverse transcriptase domain-containing protein [Tanacetum coccineum]